MNKNEKVSAKRSFLVIVVCFSYSFLLMPATAENAKAPYVSFGQKLFFDKQLSFNKTKSCASCHDPKLAFTDGYRKSLGATADIHVRNSPTLLNVSDFQSLTAANPYLVSLEEQIRAPLFNAQIIELGISGHEVEILERIKGNPSYYKDLDNFSRESTPFTMDIVIHSLAEYLRQLKSYNSRFDRYKLGEIRLSPSELRGEKLFNSQRFACSNCHGGRNFNTPAEGRDRFTRNGFFSDEGHFKTPALQDTGLELVTGLPEDRGKFRIPTLRNVMLTSPYMHDGSVETLTEVIEVYSKGGRAKSSPNVLIKPFSSPETERKDLLAFLGTLTDTSLLLDGRN